MNYIPIFRGKHTDEFQRDKWIYGAYLKGGIYSITKAGAIVRKLIDKSTLGMSTGILAEKSHRGENEIDRMIFDGDICDDGIQYKENHFKSKRFVVEYVADKAAFYAVYADGRCLLSEVRFAREAEISIVGNIHDNPEMMDKE